MVAERYARVARETSAIKRDFRARAHFANYPFGVTPIAQRRIAANLSVVGDTLPIAGFKLLPFGATSRYDDANCND